MLLVGGRQGDEQVLDITAPLVALGEGGPRGARARGCACWIRTGQMRPERRGSGSRWGGGECEGLLP